MSHYKLLQAGFFASIVCNLIIYSGKSLSESVLVDFETIPALINAPSTFSRAGSSQTIEIDDVLTFSGGVVLGFPTFLPATPFITAPNFYATANHPSGGVVGDPSLSANLSIDIDASFAATTVEGLLLNGLNRPGNYTIEAFSNGTLVDSVFLNDLTPNFSSGFDLFKLDSNGLPITLVLFSPDLSDGEWDYFIDTIAINEPLGIVVPIPAGAWLFASGIISLFGLRKSFRRFIAYSHGRAS